MDEKKLAELFGAAIQPLKDELGKLAKLRASKPEESEDFKSLKGDYEKLSGDFTSIKADYESLKNDVEAYKKKLDESLADNTRSHIEPDTGDNKDKNEDLI